MTLKEEEVPWTATEEVKPIAQLSKVRAAPFFRVREAESPKHTDGQILAYEMFERTEADVQEGLD